MFKLGLNPYGIACSVGLAGVGTPRECEDPLGLDGFLRFAYGIGAQSVEIHGLHLAGLDAEAIGRYRGEIAEAGLEPIVSTDLKGLGRAIEVAPEIGARTVRVGLSPVLCGARAAQGAAWPEYVANARRGLKEFGPKAAEKGLALAIEDHQDFGSEELLGFCEEAGDNVGVCLDTGNPLAVGEDPVAFAERVAHRVRHVHLKDYRAQFTDEGYRLVRCAIGDGCVPFETIHEILARHHRELTASLEPGALEARHIRLLCPDWWEGYPPRSARELAACLAAARIDRLPDDAEWRTPWEQELGAKPICEYEMAMMQRSLENMRTLGWLP